MEKRKLLLELQYFPCIRYFSYLYYYKEVLIEVNDHYEKQSYRNRCKIRGANKIEDLIIPIKHSKNKIVTKDACIDYDQKWENIHMRAIRSAYGKAPFFEYYQEEILKVFNKKHSLLVNLNKDILTKCLELIELDINLSYTEEYVTEVEKHDLYEARGQIHPKKAPINSSIFKPVKYFQVFGNNFVPDISVIDLIFCEGPNAKKIIKESIVLR